MTIEKAEKDLIDQEKNIKNSQEALRKTPPRKYTGEGAPTREELNKIKEANRETQEAADKLHKDQQVGNDLRIKIARIKYATDIAWAKRMDGSTLEVMPEESGYAEWKAYKDAAEILRGKEIADAEAELAIKEEEYKEATKVAQKDYLSLKQECENNIKQAQQLFISILSPMTSSSDVLNSPSTSQAASNLTVSTESGKIQPQEKLFTADFEKNFIHKSTNQQVNYSYNISKTGNECTVYKESNGEILPQYEMDRDKLVFKEAEPNFDILVHAIKNYTDLHPGEIVKISNIPEGQETKVFKAVAELNAERAKDNKEPIQCMYPQYPEKNSPQATTSQYKAQLGEIKQEQKPNEPSNDNSKSVGMG